MYEIRVLIVDDHSLFRQSLGRFLLGRLDRVVGQCGSAAEAAQTFSRVQADVVLLDFDLGDQEGIDLIAELKSHQPSAKVLIVTAGMPQGSALKVMTAGASGIFLKRGTLEDTFPKAVRCVAAGNIWLDSDETKEIVSSSLARPETPDRPRLLTARQSEVMRGILDGLTNKEIAVALNGSEGSVKAVIQELFRKAGVRTRSQLVRIAIEKHSSDWLQSDAAEPMPRG